MSESQHSAKNETLNAAEIYHRASCGYVTARLDGTITHANDTFLRWIDKTFSDVEQSIPFSSLLSIGSKIYMETHFTPLLLMHKQVREIQLELKTADGKRRPVLVNADLETDESGNPAQFRALLIDISQRKQYELELLAAKRKAESMSVHLKMLNAQLKEFSYMVTHDLKTPLSNIIQMSELLKNDADNLDAEQVQHGMTMIYESSLKMNNYIENMLDSYNNDRFSAETNQPTTLTDCLAPVLVMLNPENLHQIFVSGSDYKLTVNIPAIQQIFLNLLANSIKYSQKPSSTIQISTEEDESFYYFQVTDDGPGISNTFLERLFRKHATSGDPDRWGNQGTGLGLANVHQTIQKMGGNISIQNNPDTGCTVFFTIEKPNPNSPS